MRRRGLVVLAATTALVASPAGAQAPAPNAADALFKEGREAMKKQDYEKACARFAASQQIDPAPGTLLNLAECQEKRGRLAAAWRLLHDAIKQLPAGDERARIAKERAAALARRVPHLVVRQETDFSTFTDIDLTFTATLTSPPGMNYDLELWGAVATPSRRRRRRTGPARPMS